MIDHQRIFEVACRLKPLYDEEERLFNELLDTNGNLIEQVKQWENSVRVYQEALLAEAETIAKATNNSPSNMRLLFRVQSPTMITWTPQDVLNVARYESFNRYAWNHPGASVRNQYEFPVEHV